MANKKREEDWARAKRLCRLNAETVRMAKELGLNPRKLTKNIPSKSQPWKAPVHVWIRDLYEKMQAKSARRRAAKQAGQAGSAETNSVVPAEPPPTGSPQLSSSDGSLLAEPLGQAPEPAPPDDDPDLRDELDEFGEPLGLDREPNETEVEEQDRAMLRRQSDLRAAAENVARSLAGLAVVQRVVLIGSVAVLLWKEVPRFRDFRRGRIAVWHECKDADLAVWVSSLADLRSLQRARSQALNELLAERNIGVAHHQVEMFIMETGTDRYLGRLCCFGSCPKGKPDCRAPGCGATKFLKQHENFTFRSEALAPDRSVVLYEVSRDNIPF